MSTPVSLKPSDMIQNVEIQISYGSNPVTTLSRALSQQEINTLSLGGNRISILDPVIIDILNNTDSSVRFLPSLIIYYKDGTSNTVSGTTFNEVPKSSRFGYKEGEIIALTQPKPPSQALINLALNTSFYRIPYMDFIPIYDQGQLGSCTANALAFCFEYCQCRQNLSSYNPQVPFTPPSRLFIYYNERNYEGSTANAVGAQIYDGIKSLNEIGACSSTLWPYDIHKFATRPDPICYTQASQNIALTFNSIQTPTPVVSQSMPAILQSLIGIQAALVSGYPVAFAFTVFPFFLNGMGIQTNPLYILECPSSPVDMSTSHGSHCVVIVGYYNNFVTPYGSGVFFVRNSWGPYWGTNLFNLENSPGYFYIPYQFFTNQYTDTYGNSRSLVTDFWTINTVATNNVTIGGTSKGYGNLQFYRPNSVVVDLSGNYVVADTLNNRIQVVSPSGQFIRFIGNLGLDASGNPISGSGNCQFNQPSCVAVDLSGNYVVLDTFNYRIQVISPLGVFIRQFGSYAIGGNGNFNKACGITVDLSGNYVIADSGNNLIQVISQLGVFQRQFASYTNPSQSNSPINFNNPTAVTIDLSGNYVVVNTGNNCIVVISPLGNFIKQFGSGGSTMGDGILNYPTGIAVDLSGNYLVADSQNNLIQIFTPSGVFHSELGSVSLNTSTGTIPGPFNVPQGVAVDKTGKYIVVDSGNNRILAFNV
jgi:C1A family cysteine protease